MTRYAVYKDKVHKDGGEALVQMGHPGPQGGMRRDLRKRQWMGRSADCGTEKKWSARAEGVVGGGGDKGGQGV